MSESFPEPNVVTEPEVLDVGLRLKYVRQRVGLSQRELARRAGVTNAAISLIEQNKASPSIASLKKVLDGIPMAMADFFSLNTTPDPRVFFAASDLVEIGNEAISLRQVAKNLMGKKLQVLHERYQPGADTGDDLYHHEAEESGLVLSGEIEITVGGETKVLKAGDAYYFDSRKPHRFRNLGQTMCEVVSVCTPPSF